MKNPLLWQRFGRALCCSLLSVSAVGSLDASHATGQSDSSIDGVALWFSTVGLWVIPCVVLTLGSTAFASWLLAGIERDSDPSTPSVRVWLVRGSAGLMPALCLGFLCLLMLGPLGLELMASDATPGQGAALYGLIALISALGGAWIGRWSTARIRAWSQPKSTTRAVILAVFLVALFLGLVQLGETSGVGGPLSLWGVLRREELELDGPLYIAIVGACGVYAALARIRIPTALAAGVVLALSGFAVGSWGMATATALRIEQAGSASTSLLHAYQRVADQDGDGFAASFGGGDCNDEDPTIQPEATDIAGNGVDEDCSGADAKGEAGDRSSPDALATDSTTVGTSHSGADGVSQVQGSVRHGESGLPEDANIVFITIDTLRYDLGYAGNPRPLSPNLDKLAGKSLVYDNAYALASYTSKSLGPLMIGRYGSETNRGWMHFNKYPESDIMVQERLSRAGIFTMSVQGHWYFKADTGLGRGFDVLDMSAAPKRPQGEGDKTVNSEQISDAAIALLKQPERNQQRFFMWVHYLDPHAEYVTHADFTFGNNGRAKYDGEIAFTDHHVGRVLQALEGMDFAKRTIVVVTSDHGEAFGEHGLIRHGFELWEELIHVPLIVYIPGAEPRHVKVRRSAIDLVPTFLDVLAVPLPQGDDSLSGQSLMSEWSGGPSPERPIFVDMPAGPYNGDRQAYIDDDVKLVVSNSRPMGLYNLAIDPGETKNLSNQTEQVESMLQRLKAFRSKLRVVKVKPQ